VSSSEAESRKLTLQAAPCPKFEALVERHNRVDDGNLLLSAG
jgi:hypothetical protein